MRVLALLHASAPLLLSSDRAEGRQILDMTLEVPTTVDAGVVADALSAVADQVVVLPGRATDADDVATRVLDGAADIAVRPALAPLTVANLVLAESWEVTSAAVGEDTSADVMRVQWTPDTHVVLRRPGVPFTRVERARASALLRLTGALARVRGDDPPSWMLTTSVGLSIVVRLARPEDAEDVRAMHERSSEVSRFQRYSQPMSQWREENLRRITGGHRGATLVVLLGGQIVGIGNVFPDQPRSTAAGGAARERCEIALLVEDAFQGRGIGSVLLDRLVDLARELGFTEGVAYVQLSNERMRAMLRSRGWVVGEDPGLLTVSLTVDDSAS
jgi:GNAT superfamily N-acetyltransferase